MKFIYARFPGNNFLREWNEWLRIQKEFSLKPGLKKKYKMKEITWKEFEQVELRTGTIIEVHDFPEALKPAYILKIDFGEEIGIKKSSAQITDLYSKEELIGKQTIAVINFPAKQIGPIQSQCLVTGFPDEDAKVVLAVPDKSVPNGKKLF